MTVATDAIVQMDNITGVSTHTVQDRAGNVRATWQQGPPDSITDYRARRQGLSAAQRLTGTGDGAEERLDARYRVRKSKANFFRLGRVLMCFYAEPTGTEVTYDARWRQTFHIKPRRFVVVTEGETSCTAIAIWTYEGQGVSRPGVVKSDHAIIYSGPEPPDPTRIPTRAERPNRDELPMQPRRLRMDGNDFQEPTLDPMSRINLAKVYTIEHTVSARDVGMINPRSLLDLFALFYCVQQTHAARNDPLYPRLLHNAQNPADAIATSRSQADSLGTQQPGVSKAFDTDDDDEDDDDDDDDDLDDDDEDEGIFSR